MSSLSFITVRIVVCIVSRYHTHRYTKRDIDWNGGGQVGVVGEGLPPHSSIRYVVH